jgi:hypothetical protein
MRILRILHEYYEQKSNRIKYFFAYFYRRIQLIFPLFYSIRLAKEMRFGKMEIN